MARSSTTFDSDSRKKLPPRGKNKRTLILEAIKQVSGDDELAFYVKMVERAFNPDDSASAMLMKEVFSRLYPGTRPTMPTYEFPYEGNDIEKIKALEVAVSTGSLPADVARMMVDIIKNRIDIEKSTELLERIERIEAALNASKS